MARTNPHHDWDEPARTGAGTGRQSGAEWESLRNEIVALLDHVEDQVAGARHAERTPAPRPIETGRRHEALRSVRQAVSRFAERPEAEIVSRREPSRSAARDSVTDAINQIRARQGAAKPVVPAAAPAPASAPIARQADELSGFARSVSALNERIERFEASVSARLDRFADQPDVAAQVAQLSEVIEMLAGAVANNGDVRRITQLAETVERLATHQVEVSGRSELFHDRQDAGLQAIEDTVRNIYERIDALEMARGTESPEIERIGREVGIISSAIAASGSDTDEIIARIDALHQRVADLAEASSANDDLGLSIEALRDAVVMALEPRLAALEQPVEVGPSAATLALEAQIRHIAQTVERTSEQLETLAAVRASEPVSAAAPAPDLNALADMIVERTREAFDGPQAQTASIDKADLDALEARLASLFSATEPEPQRPDPGFNVVRESIAQVDSRLGRLEAMLNARPAPAATPAQPLAAMAEPQPRRRELPDTMPSDPVSGAPRKVLSEDPAITLEAPRAQPAPEFRFDPQTIDRPAKPQSSLAAESEKPFAPERAPAPDARELVGSRPAVSRSNFIEAARRSARQQPEEESEPKSLIARALSRFQKSEAEAVETPEPAQPVAPVVEAAPDPFVGHVAEPTDVAELDGQGFLARNRRALLLGAALVVVIAMTVPLVLNRVTRPAPQQAQTPPAASETVAPEPEMLPDEAVSEVSSTTSDSLMSTVRMIDAPATLSPATLNAEAMSANGMIDPIQTASLGTPPDRYIDRSPAFNAEVAPSAPMPEIVVSEAIEPQLLRDAAAAGDARAQFEVGAIYTEGQVVEQDLGQAAAWYERSAAQGFAPAQYRLGNLYEGGRGVERDVNQARLWYLRAAEAGNRMSMHNLASLYAGGELETQDFAAAAHWFEEAAARGLTDSQFNLGMLYARGLGVEQSFEKSYFWFSLAARAGDQDAVAAREDVSRSIETDAIGRLDDQLAAWQPSEIDLAANFAPIGTWDGSFDPGQAIANREVVERVQMLLVKLGFDIGRPDGIAGPRTRDAILAFERATGMNEKGEINPRLLAVLGSQPV